MFYGWNRNRGNVYCEHLEPKLSYIERKGGESWEDKTPWHTCKIKEAMGLKDTNCAFVSYTKDHGLEFLQYDESHAKSCPMYTDDQQTAERMRLLIKDFSEYLSSRKLSP